MKKIHDIKIRAKRPKAKMAENNQHHFADFWSVKDQKRKHLKLEPINWAVISRPLLTTALVLFVVMMILGRVYVVKAEMQLKVISAKQEINKAVDLLSSGDFDQAFSEASKAKADIADVKLNLQSWGQDSQYLRLIGYRSDLVATESLLNSLDQILDIAVRSKSIVESTVNNLSSNGSPDLNNLSLKVDVAAIDSYLQQYQENIATIEKQVSSLGSNNSMISTNEANRIIKSLGSLDAEIQGIRDQYIPIFKWFMGETGSQKTMLLFQNNAELRGSGGFMGSYAIIESDKSQINKINFQTNIYKLDAAAGDNIRTDAPDEFKILAGGKLYFRDSNYAVDGPQSFVSVIDTYKLESGEQLGGIIALDTTLVTKLLDITGPIDLPQYGLTINSGNFLKEIQTEVERDYFTRSGSAAENEPKKVLSDMMPVLLNKVFAGLKSPENRSKIMNVLKSCLNEKHILFYSKETSCQNLIEDLNLGGEIPQGSYDYFFSHSTNIGGLKSSLNIVENVNDNVVIADDGTVSHQVTIIRQHTGDGNWPDFTNVNLMRILLPLNSHINSFKKISGNFYAHNDKQFSKNPDHYDGEEAGKTKLSFWMNTEPQKTSQVAFTYQSGYKYNFNDKKYQFYLQKEAGTPGYWYNIKVNYPESWRPSGASLDGFLEYKIFLNSDKLLNIGFEG